MRRPHTALALVLMLAAPLPAMAQQPGTPTPPTITVTGTGEASARPDQALATFTVLRTAETARAALDDANKAMREVSDGMRNLGAEDRDLQTSGFSINPQYRYDNTEGSQQPPTIVGYEVRNTLTVRVRDLARLGEILDQAVTLGVNQGGEIRFELAEPGAVEDAALKDAVADAMATARLIAEAAGVTLGAVREIRENVGMAPPPMPFAAMEMRTADAKSVPVEAGENSYNASVSMVFAIAD
ncbi:MAG: SIMPL domain-containing protein [Aurantimonas endophytica]|uniref:SIMPL domain-containing protein n=1 Tax=Aurantimonas endophytica TaxID=1522175 RepID=UPI003002E37F